MRLAGWCLALWVIAAPALARGTADPLLAHISTEDVAAFFQIYDDAGGRPDAAALQRYLEQGSVGVQGFIPDRIQTSANLADVIAREPQLFADARACARRLGDVEGRVRAAFLALSALYPEAIFPQTFILIGAGNSGGTANDNALMIGLEVMCRGGAPDPYPLDVRLSHIIAHELIHSLQVGFSGGTLLAQALNEGVADFVCELISGRTANPHLQEWTKGHEREIERRFAAAMHGDDLSAWLYNGVGTPDAPGDLGYWVGYRIARAYYESADDKRAAIRALVQGTDAPALLRASGWRPQER